MRKVRLRSECGLYIADPVPAGDLRYRLYDRAGCLLGEAESWRNLNTPSRIRFELGLGPVTAVFGRPRHPRWFRRRWVVCFDIWIDELKLLIEGFGCEVLRAWKPDINCYNHVGFRASREQLRGVDAELDRRGLAWNGPPRNDGQWDIECPDVARLVNPLAVITIRPGTPSTPPA